MKNIIISDKDPAVNGMADDPNVMRCAELRNQVSDWQNKLLKAISSGDSGLIAAAIYGELLCRIQLIELRLDSADRRIA